MNDIALITAGLKMMVDSHELECGMISDGEGDCDRYVVAFYAANAAKLNRAARLTLAGDGGPLRLLWGLFSAGYRQLAPGRPERRL